MSQRIIRPCGLVVRQQQLLVLRYQYGEHDRFNLPGGNLEPDETIEDCLVREFKEELNLIIHPETLFCVAETHTEGKQTQHLVFELTTHGEPRLNPLAVKARELLWLTPDSIETAPLYPAIGSALGPWMRGHRTETLHLGLIDQPWFH